MLKRKGLPKKKAQKSNILFDFINDITVGKKNILTKENNHLYSKFMVTRFLSMHEPYLPLVDVYLNKYQGSMSNADFHKFCIALFPKKKIYAKYIKGIPLVNQCKEQVKIIQDHFQLSEAHAFEYYQLAGDDLVLNIKRMYGLIDP